MTTDVVVTVAVSAVLLMVRHGWRRRLCLGDLRSRPLRLIAITLPTSYAAQWAEEMQAQLNEATDGKRRKITVNLVCRAPMLWLSLWWRHCTRPSAVRRTLTERAVAGMLWLALVTPPATNPLNGRFLLLHATGLSRVRIGHSARRVPALYLTHRLLKTRDPALATARKVAHSLLEARERAHLASRAPHRERPNAWTRQHVPQYSARLQRAHRARDTVDGQAGVLRDLLAEYVETCPDTSGRRGGVFLVHGRDLGFRARFADLLRSLDQRVMEWPSAVAATGCATPSLSEVVQAALREANAVVVLLTPDDVVRLRGGLWRPEDVYGDRCLACQPRPNVLLELGMALGVCPERTIIVEVGPLRPISDLAGYNTIRFDGSFDAICKFVARLKQLDTHVNDSGEDWREPGRFVGLDLFGPDRFL